MNNLTTRKIVLGMLMVLVLAFGVLGVCEALTLSETSDTVQVKEPTDPAFEIRFNVGLTAPTAANDVENPSRRVTDHNTLSSADPAADVSIADGSNATRIDSNGYKVFYIGTTAYRRTSANSVGDVRPTISDADLTLGSSRGSSNRAENPAPPFYVDTSDNVVDSNGRAVYVRWNSDDDLETGDDDPGYDTYQRAKASPIPAVDVKYRADYNEEQISIIVSDGTVDSVAIRVKDTNIVIPSVAPNGDDVLVTETSGILTSRMTLECTISAPGSYTITITDTSPARDFPRGLAPVTTGVGVRAAEIAFNLHVTEGSPDVDREVRVDGTTRYLRVDTAKAIEHISPRFMVVDTDNGDTPVDGNLELRYKIVKGNGTVYASKTSTTGIYRGPNQDLTVHQNANVYLNTNGTDNEVAVSIAGQDRQTFAATIVYEYSGTEAPTNNQQQNQQNQNQQNQQAARLAIATSGTGTTRSVVVSAFDTTNTLVTGRQITLSGTALTVSQQVTTGTAVTITLPSTPATYTLVATDPAGAYPQQSTTVTVAASALGTLTISPTGAAVNGVQTVSITARTADGAVPAGALTVRLSGTGFTTTSASVLTGSVNAGVTLPTAAGTYTLIVSATGYNSASTLLVVGTTTRDAPPPPVTVGEPDRIAISGQATRSATANEALATPLRVQVFDDNGNGVEDVRVVFRVNSGRGRLSDRGSGRAVQIDTDSSGYARADFTPLSDGTIEVRASVAGVRGTVTFTITTGSAPDAGDSGTGGTPSGSSSGGTLSPVVHVGMASRPPMLWVDGGAIYALVGADAQKFAPGVDNALNITVAGGKVYWTEKTGDSSGTINSANLNGSGVTELASIMAVPMGIAVDVAGSKLYWTNSRGRIQSADLGGSGITNELPGDLPSPMDLALAGGNAYWTQGNGSVRFVNLNESKSCSRYFDRFRYSR